MPQHQIRSIARKARAADQLRLLALIREYYHYDGIPFDAKSIGPALRKLLRDESLGCVWMIHRGSALAGYIILTFNYDLEFGGLQGIVTDLFCARSIAVVASARWRWTVWVSIAAREEYR